MQRGRSPPGCAGSGRSRPGIPIAAAPGFPADAGARDAPWRGPSSRSPPELRCRARRGDYPGARWARVQGAESREHPGAKRGEDRRGVPPHREGRPMLVAPEAAGAPPPRPPQECHPPPEEANQHQHPLRPTPNPRRRWLAWPPPQPRRRGASHQGGTQARRARYQQAARLPLQRYEAPRSLRLREPSPLDHPLHPLPFRLPFLLAGLEGWPRFKRSGRRSG